jgi:hypothetical protein
MDDRFAAEPVPGWYILGALASLVLTLAGCALYGMHVITDPATLPLDERSLMEAEPGWVAAALGAAAAIGVIGSVLLILRKKAAVPAMMIALLLVLVWFAGLIFVPAVRNLLSVNDIAVAVAVAVVGWTIYGFARHSRQRSWLA